MEIRRYAAIVRRRLLLVVAIVVAALVAGWLVTPRGHTYTATSTLYVGSRSIDINPTSGEVSGDRVAGLDRLISTFTAMVSTRPIATEAVKINGAQRSVDQVLAEASAQQVTDTNLIRVTVTDADPAMSRSLADAVAASLVNRIRTFEPRSSTSASDQVISLYQRAEQPTVSNPRGLVRNLVLSGLFGVLVAGGLLALLEYLDITLRSAEEVERELGLRVLAVVPALGKHLPIAPPLNVESPVPRNHPARAARGPDA